MNRLLETVVRRPVVHYPVAIEHEKYVGTLNGYHHPDSAQFNIIEYNNPNSDFPVIGEIFSSKEAALVASDQLIGFWHDENIFFHHNDLKCNLYSYELTLNVFSRNSGILESSRMLNKSAIISGCGSVGSLVALELARSGVGRFLLIDNDTFAYHNICRHQCGVFDVGKFKTHAVAERILNINPLAKIVKCTSILEDVQKEVFDLFCDKDTIIIGCADNREGDLYADRISKLYNISFVSIGFWERAFAGEIFYSIPGEMPGYESIFNGEGISNRISVNRRLYTFEEDLLNTRFEPGISVDINFITLIAIKIIIDLLNRNEDWYVPRLLNNLSQFTLVCNTNNVEIGGEQAEIFSYPLQVTTSIQV